MEIEKIMFFLGSILMYSVGVLLIREALKIMQRQRQGEAKLGPEAEISIWGVSMKGRRTFGVFVCGIVLIGVPMIYAANLMNPREVRANVVPEPKQFATKNTLDDPTYEGLTLLKDIRILDLRGRIEVPEDARSE